MAEDRPDWPHATLVAWAREANELIKNRNTDAIRDRAFIQRLALSPWAPRSFEPAEEAQRPMALSEARREVLEVAARIYALHLSDPHPCAHQSGTCTGWAVDSAQQLIAEVERFFEPQEG